ncbi:MAG TPA: HlyD family efflux transporter periplasmic adaptor subunit [Polyangiales bacterium]|nr:HlyD family efflux transporter periplasmic adaptor subunit [Polyangiales bacterium]
MRHRSYAKKAIWMGALLATAAATAWTLRPQPVHVTTATVTRGSLASTVRGEGRTKVRDLFVVAAPVDGQLERVIVQPGDVIEANDTLASIRAAASRPLDARTRAEASAAVMSAKAAVVRAEAAEAEARVALEHAQSQLETIRRLATSGSAPADELTHRAHEAEMRRRGLEVANAAAAQARAEYLRADAVLGIASDTSQPTAVRAPARGRILRVLKQSAGPIGAGTPLFELGDANRLEIEADLLSTDVARVREGATATVSGWGGTQTLGARVRRVDPAAFTKVSALGLEEQRVHVVLDLTEPPPPGLGHDYRVEVAIVTWEGRDVLRIASTALFRAGDRWAAFKVSSSRAVRTVVDLGPSDGSWTVVTSGLRAGDEVVTQPSDSIENGTRVRHHE